MITILSNIHKCEIRTKPSVCFSYKHVKKEIKMFFIWHTHRLTLSDLNTNCSFVTHFYWYLLSLHTLFPYINYFSESSETRSLFAYNNDERDAFKYWRGKTFFYISLTLFIYFYHAECKYIRLVFVCLKKPRRSVWCILVSFILWCCGKESLLLLLRLYCNINI